MQEYNEVAQRADENGKITITLQPGANYLAIGPDFDQVGHVDNYQFQDCNEIRKSSPNFKERTQKLKLG